MISYERAYRRSSWWHNCSALLAQFPTRRESDRYDWYRIADVPLGIDSDDAALQTRFRELYRECTCAEPTACANSVRCTVQRCPQTPAHLVTFTPAEDLELVDFILASFGDHGYLELDSRDSDWRLLGITGSDEPVLAARANLALVNQVAAWQPVIGNSALNWAMRLQRDFLFLHAASVAIDGVGVLLVGDKGAGKSTLSSALAALGHDFLADEITAVRIPTRKLVPFRRSVSLRAGPQASTVERALRSVTFSTETYPDGKPRVRVDASELFPASAARPAVLHDVLWLCGFEERPRLVQFVPGVPDLRALAPLACTYYRASKARPMMQVASWCNEVRCFRLYPGMPDETAMFIEELARTA